MHTCTRGPMVKVRETLRHVRVISLWRVMQNACTNQRLMTPLLSFSLYIEYLDRTNGDTSRRSLAASPSLYSPWVRLPRSDTRTRLPATAIHKIGMRKTMDHIGVQFVPVFFNSHDPHVGDAS